MTVQGAISQLQEIAESDLITPIIVPSLMEIIRTLTDDSGDLSDGYHTFNQLYYQRTILFAQIVNDYKSMAWKTRCHEDGEPCFGGGWFLVTIDTPNGAYGYHCEDKYWDLFKCDEIPKAKHWDGYTEKDVTRLLSLSVMCDKMKRFEIYEEGYEATEEYGLAHYIGAAYGENFIDACRNYIKKTGYGEIYKAFEFEDGKERAGNWRCYWYPTLEEAQKSFG